MLMFLSWVVKISSKTHQRQTGNNIAFRSHASDKEPTYQCRRHKRCGFNPWVGKIPWRTKWQPTPVCLPGESHGQRSSAGCSPWGCKESDTSEQLSIQYEAQTRKLTCPRSPKQALEDQWTENSHQSSVLSSKSHSHLLSPPLTANKDFKNSYIFLLLLILSFLVRIRIKG